MKKRHVFSTVDLRAAQKAIAALREADVPKDDISLIARRGVALPSEHKEVGDDFRRGGWKGVMIGAISGLFIGLIALMIPALGVSFIGVVVAIVIGGAAGGWAGMMTGTSEPGPVRRQFESEISAGHVLIVVDGSDDILKMADAVLTKAHAIQLPFEAPTAAS